MHECHVLSYVSAIMSCHISCYRLRFLEHAAEQFFFPFGPTNYIADPVYMEEPQVILKPRTLWEQSHDAPIHLEGEVCAWETVTDVSSLCRKEAEDTAVTRVGG